RPPRGFGEAGEDAGEAAGGGGPAVEGGAAAAGGGLEAAPYVGFAEPAAQFGGERGRVLRRDEDAGHPAVGGAADRLRHAADVGGEDRDAARQGLGDR